MIYIIVAAIMGAGLVTGLLFAFSNFVMRALAELPNEHGMFAMQQINEKVINPVFMLFFLGTPVCCVMLVAGSIIHGLETAGHLFLLMGSLCYLIGPFGITMLFNVPLNNRLARAESSADDGIWGDYQVRWQRWNHLRTGIGVVSIVLLSVGLGHLEI